MESWRFVLAFIGGIVGWWLGGFLIRRIHGDGIWPHCPECRSAVMPTFWRRESEPWFCLTCGRLHDPKKWVE